MAVSEGCAAAKPSARECAAIVRNNPSAYYDLPDGMQERVSVVHAFIESNPRNVWRISRDAYEAWRASKLAQEWLAKRGVLSAPPSLEALAPRPPDLRASGAHGSMAPVTGGSAIETVAVDSEDALAQPVYYISDLHVEHQIDLFGKSLEEILVAVRDRARELAASVTSDRGVIVIAGDVADSSYLAGLFFSCLCACWPPEVRASLPIVATLGNHELWDVGDDGAASVDELVERYEHVYRGVMTRNLYLAHNELLLSFLDGTRQVLGSIDEGKILELDDGELRERVKDSAVAILAGIGFSGLDQKSSPPSDMYGSVRSEDGCEVPRVTPDENSAQSARFRALHDKLLRCAGDLPLIVVTHTPMRCWSKRAPNPGWVYISGHTHQNTLERGADGTCVLSDNQMGYKPRPWRFKAFAWRYGSDPFRDWDDGTYEITAREYRQFNYGRGITMNYNDDRAVIMAKRDGVYMFFVDTPRGLRMLEGGKKRVVKHDLRYYYDNLARYHELVKAAFEPYRHALKTVSMEVRAFGGTGTVHGCIVDIDSLHHVFLNPFDGSIVPYFAWDMIDKQVYRSVASLLEGTLLERRYIQAAGDGLVPLLADHAEGGGAGLASVPRAVLDTRMYEPSRIMRAVQYVFDKGVVRIWNDDVLALGKGDRGIDVAGSGSPNGASALEGGERAHGH